MTALDCPTLAGEAAALPRVDGGWTVVLADPPWRFASNSEARPGRNARRHYQCMTVEKIAALPVREIVAPAALLLMWVTVPFRHRADEVVRAWGFRSKSEIVWIKSRIATGYWARNRHEVCVVATRGGFPCPRPALFADSVIEAPTREHSRKPDQIQEVLDARLPDARRLEMFARRSRPGWTAWGNEADRFDEVMA